MSLLRTTTAVKKNRTYKRVLPLGRDTNPTHGQLWVTAVAHINEVALRQAGVSRLVVRWVTVRVYVLI